MSVECNLYNELRETLRLRDSLREHGVFDMELRLGKDDRLYRNRLPKIDGKYTRVSINTGKFEIIAIVPEDRIRIIDFIESEGYTVETGEMNG
jgi:hypothetical protein